MKYNIPPGYFGNAYARLAEQLAHKPCPRCLTIAHESLKPVCNLVYGHDKAPAPEFKVGVQETDGFQPSEPMPRKKLTDSKTALVGYSGGKDSIATAIKMRAKGFKVEGVHVQNLNKSNTDELKAAVESAKLLNMPLHILHSSAVGKKTVRLESPVKNLMVLGMMVDLGVPRGIQNYAMGILPDRDEGVWDFSTDMDFSDSPAVMFAGSELFRQLDGFKFDYQVVGDWHTDCYDSIRTILSVPKGNLLLKEARSCGTQFRFKEHRKRHNEKKYKVKLLPGRCGSCWKCCIEYMTLEAMKVIKPCRPFWQRCWDFLLEYESTDHITDQINAMLERAASDPDAIRNPRRFHFP